MLVCGGSFVLSDMLDALCYTANFIVYKCVSNDGDKDCPLSAL